MDAAWRASGCSRSHPLGAAFNRVLQPGGTVQISVYDPPGQLRQALAANGLVKLGVRPALAEGAEQLVMATWN